MKDSFQQQASKLVLLITAALIAAVTFFRVHAYQDPSGGDGYFYLKQAEWLFSHWQFYHADYSFVFIPLGLLTQITGSALLAFQMLSCFNYFLILCALGFIFYKYLGAWSLYQRTFIAGLLMLLLSFQMPLLRLGFEFIKNGFAIALLLSACALFFNNKFKTALALGLLAALTHKTVALMAIAFTVVFIFQSNRVKKKILAAGIAILAATILLNPRLAKHILNFLTQIQFEKIDNLFSLNSHLIWSQMILIFFWLILFISQIKKIKNSASFLPYQKAIIFTLMFFVVLPLLPFFAGANIEIKWRLMIFSFGFAFVLYSVALSFFKNKKVIIATFLASIALMAVEYYNESGFPWIVPHSSLAPDVDRLIQIVKPNEELITHHGMQFYIDYKTPIRARSLLNPEAPPVYQLAYVPEFFLLNPEAADDINQAKLVSIGHDYALFHYSEFQALMKSYPFLKHWRNTYKERPAFVQSY